MDIEKFLKLPYIQDILAVENLKEVYYEYSRVYNPTTVYKITEFLLDNGIEPLDYLNEILPDMYRNINLHNVILPENINCIYNYGFSYCELSSVFIPDTVTEIGFAAFAECANLRDISVPAHMQSIDDCAFRACDNLKIINFRGTKQQWNDIAKSSYWSQESFIETIICNDGVIEL